MDPGVPFLSKVEKLKQVIVVREDLKMSKGKLAVQVAHASVSAVMECILKGGEWERWLWTWYKTGQKKVALKVKDLDSMLRAFRKAIESGLPAFLVEDAGLTELEPGTLTCVGIGPAPEDRIDEITRSLPLL